MIDNPNPTSGAAVASLVCGIIGVLGGWCTLGIPCVLAVIFGHAGLIAIRTNAKQGRGLAVAGLVLGYVFVVPGAVLFFLVFLGLLASLTSSSP